MDKVKVWFNNIRACENLGYGGARTLGDIKREYDRLVTENEKLKQSQEASPLETLVNCPKPFTAEFLTYLLINALRNLNERQRHNLALSLAVRDPLFSIEEYEDQLGN